MYFKYVTSGIIAEILRITFDSIPRVFAVEQDLN